MLARMFVATAVALCTLLVAASTSFADDHPRERTVSVSAAGHLEAELDMAQITIGVLTEAETASAALNENAKQFKAVLDAIKRLGIAPADIATDQFQVTPVYARQKSSSGRARNVIDGYRVLNNARVVVREVARTGEVIDAATKRGANQIGAIDFVISGIETKLDYARRQAMLNAIRRAKLYAQAAGARLGEILTISEHVSGHQPRRVQMARGDHMKMASTSIEPGQQRVSVTIHATWKLE